MMADDYEKILAALAAASQVLQSNQRELNAADMRIRCLVNITTKEAKRAMLEIGCDERVRKTAPLAAAPAMAESPAQ